VKGDFKHKFVFYYTIIFYMLAVYKFLHGMWLFQVMPELFLNRFDGFTWLFMKTGVHQWLLHNTEGWVTFDALFYSIPLIYFLSHNVFKTGSVFFGVLMLLINWLYVQCYTLYPTNSIEAHIAWLLFPVAFIVSNAKTFRLLVEGLRYFFLFFVASAGIWKIVNGGLFNPAQMSGVLLFQHADLLSNSPGYWQTAMISWLIGHPHAGYTLYVVATVIELSFVAGFVTKKYDHLLVVLFILFLVFDQLVMRIPYYEVVPFLITLRIVAIDRFPLSYAAPQRSHNQSPVS
jgi:hypothetical protein